MTAPAIQIRAVSAGYRGSPVLKNLSFDVGEGEVVGILGPNGAGKSTLFKVLSGLLPPDAGTVRLFGHDVFRMPPADRARAVAVVPQDLDIPVPYTVEEVVMMGRTASIGRLSRPSGHDHQVVERALVYTDVADIRHRPLNELSGGERQRAIVAMALAQEPRIILMDEATSHLDINHRLEIMQLVERLNAEGGMTVLMISHDLQLAAEFSRRLILLDHGSVVADGKPAEVLTEEGVRRVYHCDVRIHQDAQTGGLSILAPPRLPAGCTGKGIRIHIVAGGGCGEEVMRRLTLCGYSISCGVLNRGDFDTTVAEALGVETALEQPFSPVSHTALGSARELALKADALVLTQVPFGTGNLANLDLLDAARARGKAVFIMEGIETRDFTPTREATARVQALIANGAGLWNDVAELMTLLPKGTTTS
jgi:iron complex transport system ATP-binding protein